MIRKLCDLLIAAFLAWIIAGTIVSEWPDVWVIILAILLGILALCQCVLWVLGWRIKRLDREVERIDELLGVSK